MSVDEKRSEDIVQLENESGEIEEAKERRLVLVGDSHPPEIEEVLKGEKGSFQHGDFYHKQLFVSVSELSLTHYFEQEDESEKVHEDKLKGKANLLTDLSNDTKGFLSLFGQQDATSEISITIFGSTPHWISEFNGFTDGWKTSSIIMSLNDYRPEFSILVFLGKKKFQELKELIKQNVLSKIILYVDIESMQGIYEGWTDYHTTPIFKYLDRQEVEADEKEDAVDRVLRVSLALQHLRTGIEWTYKSRFIQQKNNIENDEKERSESDVSDSLESLDKWQEVPQKLPGMSRTEKFGAAIFSALIAGFSAPTIGWMSVSLFFLVFIGAELAFTQVNVLAGIWDERRRIRQLKEYKIRKQ